MKFLVIGASGYIGQHVVRHIEGLNYDVKTMDIAGKSQYAVDIRDASALSQAIFQIQPDVVVHLAGYIEVSLSMERPMEFYNNNVSGTINVITACKNAGVRHIIFASTAAVFKTSPLPIPETYYKSPISVYGKTKLMCEEILYDAARKYGFQASVVRFFNAAGAHHSGMLGENHNPETHLIPILLKHAHDGTIFTINGTGHKTRDGTCERDYVHVDDLAKAIFMIADDAQNQSYRLLSDYNLGSGVGRTILEVIDSVERVTGNKVLYKLGLARAGDPAVLVCNIDRAKTKLGWHPVSSNIDNIISTAYKYHKQQWK